MTVGGSSQYSGPLLLTVLTALPASVEGQRLQLTASLLAAYTLSSLFCQPTHSNRTPAKYWVQLWGWVKLLGLISRLALASSTLSATLTFYRGQEQNLYHFFPQLPLIMPITVPIILTFFFILGLQPSSIMGRIFNGSLALLLLTFFVKGWWDVQNHFNKVISLCTTMGSLNSIIEGMLLFLGQFLHGCDGAKNNLSSNYVCIQFWLSMIAAGLQQIMITFRNCSDIKECLGAEGWTGAAILALQITTISLLLVDLYSPALALLVSITNPLLSTLSSHLVIGSACCALSIGLSHSSLLSLESGSFLLAISLEHLNRISPKISLNLYNASGKTSKDGKRYSKLETLEEDEGSSTDASDIDAIVEDYLQTKVRSGEEHCFCSGFLGRKTRLVFHIIITVFIGLLIRFNLYIPAAILCIGWVALGGMTWRAEEWQDVMMYSGGFVLVPSLPYSVLLIIPAWAALGGWLIHTQEVRCSTMEEERNETILSFPPPLPNLQPQTFQRTPLI